MYGVWRRRKWGHHVKCVYSGPLSPRFPVSGLFSPPGVGTAPLPEESPRLAARRKGQVSSPFLKLQFLQCFLLEMISPPTRRIWGPEGRARPSLAQGHSPFCLA